MRAARIAVVALGMIGGVCGIVISLSAVAFGYEAILRNEAGGVLATLLAASGVPVSAIGMMAAYVARERARFSCPILLATAMLGFISLYGIAYSLWLVPGLFLLVAGGLAFVVRRTDYVPPKDA